MGIFEKIKYIVMGSSSVEVLRGGRTSTEGVDYAAADREAKANTQKQIDQANQAREAQATAAKAKLEAEAERRRQAEQALREAEAATTPRLTQIELLPGQTEEVIKNSKWLNGNQLDRYVDHLTQRNKKK
jgi:hypothetical protein